MSLGICYSCLSLVTLTKIKTTSKKMRKIYLRKNMQSRIYIYIYIIKKNSVLKLLKIIRNFNFHLKISSYDYILNYNIHENLHSLSLQIVSFQ